MNDTKSAATHNAQVIADAKAKLESALTQALVDSRTQSVGVRVAKHGMKLGNPKLIIERE